VARNLLHSEGFADVQYVKVASSSDGYKALAAGEAYMGLLFAGGVVTRIDAGDPLVLIGGIHVGCYELFGSERVRSVRDLKGKTVAVPALGSSHHIFVASMAAYVGLDPRSDIHWAIQSPRSCGRSRSAGYWSTHGRTSHGRSISAAWWRRTATS
jgi:NitT/TauT family transport system substrate-binding protein